MCSGHLAPDYSDLRALHLSLYPVDEGDLLAQIEAASLSMFLITTLKFALATHFAALESSTPSILIRL